MSAYSNSPFAVKSIKKSTGFAPAKCDEPKEPEECKDVLIPLPRNFTRMVTCVSVACHAETGKPWLVQDVLVWNEKGGCWEEECEGIHEMPLAYKASSADPEVKPVVLPSFDGPLEVYLTGVTEPHTLFGGDATPSDMVGTILCLNGELCYIGDKPIPAAIEEIQCGGDMPESDQGVKLWIDEGVAKTQNVDGAWVQNTAFGG